jgi:UDP-glucose 4-epimerase
MKFLVTGANGFLGKHLCGYLAQNGQNFIGTVRSNPGPNEVATGNLVDFTDWDSLLKGVDVIVHSAAKAHDMSKSPDLKQIYFRTNLELTLKLASAAKKNFVKRFIFISTIKVNGEESGSTPFTADDPRRPTDDYGLSKSQAEIELLKMHEPGIFEVVVIRPCLIYGKGVKANFDNLIKLVKKKLPLPFGAITNKRSFVSVQNICNLIELCAKSPAASGQIFLVSDDQDLSLPELIRTISDALNIKVILIPIPSSVLGMALKALGKQELGTRLFSNLQVDITKTKKLLNWKPSFTTSEGVRKMLS